MPTGIPKVISYQRRALRLEQIAVACRELGREAVLEYINEMNGGCEPRTESVVDRIDRLTQQLTAEIIALRKEQK